VSEEKNIENKETSTPAIEHNENVSGVSDVPSPQLPPVNIQSESPAMEVHKHPRHVTHPKNWKEYFLEFFMIFLAVFLGFVAENIREHVVEKDRAKQYAKSLISDLENDTIMANSRIEQIARNMAKIDTLSAYVYDKDLEQINNFELFYKSVISSYNPYTWNRATLEQIKSSGSLRYFNDNIVKKVSAYDAFSRHMDYDYEFDLNRYNELSMRSEQILDMNYPTSFVALLYSSPYDSLLNTPVYEEMRNLNKPLLTKDINALKILANEGILLRRGLRLRGAELSRLVKVATDLIRELKQKYHLN
jgi:hypothetical protein